MPRGKRKKEKKSKSKSESQETNKSRSQENLPTSHISGEIYGLDTFHSFIRAREDIIAISYRVPTEKLAKEGIVARYKGQMITAIQNHARNRGQIISVQHIHIEALPMGEETYIKAWAQMRNVEGNVRRRDSPPDDPMDWKIEGVET